MTHVQVDDAFFDHPKVLSVSKDAKILSVAAICYCGNMLTDGFIPYGAVAVLGAKTGVTKTKQAVEELLAARLWEVAEGGFTAHDYLDYNTSADKVRAKRESAKIRMQRGRSPEFRANNETSSQNVQEPTTTTTTTTTGSYEPNGSTEPDLPPVSPQKTKRPKRTMTDLPLDFSVSDDMRVWARSKKNLTDSEIDNRTEHFLNYVAKSGKQYVDWVAAWRDSMDWEPRPSANSPNFPNSNGKTVVQTRAGEDRERLKLGWEPAWGSKDGGVDHL